MARAFALLLPSVWLLLNFVVEDDTTDVWVALLNLAALGAVLIGTPSTLWVLVRIVWPDFAGDTPRRTKWLIVLVVLGVTVGAFVLGLNQEHFLTCGDFAVLTPGESAEDVEIRYRAAFADVYGQWPFANRKR